MKDYLKWLLFISLFLWPSISSAEDKWWGAKWSKQDIVLETTWQVIHVLDWGTTLDSQSQPDKYSELNPILGRNPSRGAVNAYMGAGALLHIGVTHMLPPSCRPYWQGITIGVSSACVINNFSLGLRVRF